MDEFYRTGGKPKHVGKEAYPDTSLMGVALMGSQPISKLRRYKVVQCPSCGEISVTEADKFRCDYCNHSALFRARHRWNVKLLQTDEFQKANELCQIWKELRFGGVDSVQDVVDEWIRRVHGRNLDQSP
jgi:DNA-directed RNA polymerase subunit RPC12/RpoP